MGSVGAWIDRVFMPEGGSDGLLTSSDEKKARASTASNEAAAGQAQADAAKATEDAASAALAQTQAAGASKRRPISTDNRTGTLGLEARTARKVLLGK